MYLTSYMSNFPSSSLTENGPGLRMSERSTLLLATPFPLHWRRRRATAWNARGWLAGRPLAGISDIALNVDIRSQMSGHGNEDPV